MLGTDIMAIIEDRLNSGLTNKEVAKKKGVVD
jgi:hypothetical protein